MNQEVLPRDALLYRAIDSRPSEDASSKRFESGFRVSSTSTSENEVYELIEELSSPPASVSLTQKPLIIVTVLPLAGRRVRRGRKLGHYPYRAEPNGTYDISSTGSPH